MIALKVECTANLYKVIGRMVIADAFVTTKKEDITRVWYMPLGYRLRLSSSGEVIENLRQTDLSGQRCRHLQVFLESYLISDWDFDKVSEFFFIRAVDWMSRLILLNFSIYSRGQ